MIYIAARPAVKHSVAEITISQYRMDRNFDGLAGRFRQQICDTLKGRLRLEILQEDLTTHIPALSDSTDGNHPLTILDAGGGIGQQSAMLAARGHRVILCDISADMLALAREEYARTAPDADIRFLHCPIQSLPEHLDKPVDLVLLHAVLEWLKQPREVLAVLPTLTRPDGWLSILFYNRNALIWRHLMNRNFRLACQEQFENRKNPLTPARPLDPAEVYEWLSTSGLSVKAWSGIRAIHDHMPKPVRDMTPEKDLLQVERHFGRKSPYRDLARYVHMLCQKAG